MVIRRDTWGRREFLGGMAGTAGLLSLERRAGAEPPPETTTLTLAYFPTICFAPQYVSEALLRDEGFTNVQYAKPGMGDEWNRFVGSGKVSLTMDLAAGQLTAMDDGSPVVILAGVHVGCYQLFGTSRVRTIRDLKGRTVAVPALRTGAHLILSIMAANIGLDPRKDINWVMHSGEEAIGLLAAGKIDAFLGFPPEPQELRAKKIGQLVLNTATDKPWSQYFCCVVVGHREFVRAHPVATKRALRAILKAADVCARDPARAAQFLVDKGYASRYDYALQALQDVNYTKWREYNPEDTVRYYALKLHELGMITSSPQKILAQGTDWRFLNELRRELKG
jgi:NitT/TauT family transport system substrate-binding protein